MRQGGRLTYWYKVPNSMGYCIEGIIEGDSHWSDGHTVRTSLVQRHEKGYVETLNTRYELGTSLEESFQRANWVGTGGAELCQQDTVI